MEHFADLVDAVQGGRLESLRAAVQADPELLTRRDADDHSLLDHATWALLVGDYSRPPTIAPDEDGRRMAVVRWLLDEGADPNGASGDGWTPLHTALYENHRELTRLLLDRGASPRAEAHGDGGTPLLQALFWGHAEAADLLAERDIHPGNLRVAAGLGRPDRIAAAFGEDGSLRAEASARRGYYRPHPGLPEWTPSNDPQEILDEAFTYAARNGRDVAVLAELVARGADVNGAPYNGTALHWAASRGDTSLCEWLLDRGAAVDQRTVFGGQYGVTPLHCAAWLDRLAVAKLLVARGADRSLRDETNDGTPLGWAEYMKSPRVAGYLAGLA